MQPFFSIVIPTLNEEKFLPKLLKDFSNQTNKEFEIVVADGLSVDSTKDQAELFKNKLIIKFISSKKKNVAEQRNHGANFAKGRYLIFLDADARVSDGFIKKIKNFISKNKGLLFIPYLSPEKKDEQYKLLFDIDNILVEFSAYLNRKFSLGGSMIIEKNLFKIVGGFDKKLFIAEDHELIQRISKWNVNPKFIRDISITFSMRRWKREGDLQVIYKHFVATAYRLFGGEIKKKIFSYDMGGHLYDEKAVRIKRTNMLSSFSTKKLVDKIKKTFNDLFAEE